MVKKYLFIGDPKHKQFLTLQEMANSKPQEIIIVPTTKHSKGIDYNQFKNVRFERKEIVGFNKKWYFYVREDMTIDDALATIFEGK